MSKNIKEVINKKTVPNGFALVEVIAALGISALVITALISLSISTLRTSLDSKLLLEGTKIANREVELVRAYRDGYEGTVPRTWEQFIDSVYLCNNSNSPCSMSLVASHDPVIDTPSYEHQDTLEEITRSFTVTYIDGNIIPVDTYPAVVRVSVSVRWTVGDQEKGSYIYTDLSNWRGR